MADLNKDLQPPAPPAESKPVEAEEQPASAKKDYAKKAGGKGAETRGTGKDEKIVVWPDCG